MIARDLRSLVSFCLLVRLLRHLACGRQRAHGHKVISADRSIFAVGLIAPSGALSYSAAKFIFRRLQKFYYARNYWICRTYSSKSLGFPIFPTGFFCDNIFRIHRSVGIPTFISRVRHNDRSHHTRVTLVVHF